MRWELRDENVLLRDVKYSIRADSDDSVVYKVAAGAGLRSSGVMTRTQFARWARYEVTRDDDNWNRIES